MTRDRSGLLAVLPIAGGVAVVLTLVLLSGAVPLTGIAVVPVGGIVIGGAMTATSLAGRRALDELTARRGEYEAALSLGFLDRDAALEVIRPSAAQAMVPALDQTRTVGLVTLPGAFVGALFGGASPAFAARFQLVVLVGLLAAEAVAAVTLTWLLGAPAPLPLPPDDRTVADDRSVRSAASARMRRRLPRIRS